jgi:hypothetical protein
MSHPDPQQLFTIPAMLKDVRKKYGNFITYVID